MFLLWHRASTQSINATWPTAHMWPMCDGPTMTASWWRWAEPTRASWFGPTRPKVTGSTNSVTARSPTWRVRMMEVRDEMFFFLSPEIAAKMSLTPLTRFYRLWQRCDERERDQLHHQGLIHQHETHDWCETPPAVKRALCGWKVYTIILCFTWLLFDKLPFLTIIFIQILHWNLTAQTPNKHVPKTI